MTQLSTQQSIAESGPQPTQDKLIPIRELSEQTQVNTVTLRAWERRYGLLIPQRTPKGHRLYSEADVTKVRDILAFIAKGVPVSKVKALLSSNNSTHPKPSNNDWQQLIETIESTLSNGSLTQIKQSLQDLFLNYPLALTRSEILEPVIQKLEADTLKVAQMMLLQSALVDYAVLRLNAKKAKKQKQPSLLICAERSPMWKLALAAIELSDANINVVLINQPCDINTWVSLALRYQDFECIVFQEGVWRERETQHIQQALQTNDNLVFCGTAASVADIDIKRRIANPEQILAYLTDK
jgi:DNA-binding transcriptional MerR regulator